MLIKIWDAVNDPLIGWLSDRTKSDGGLESLGWWQHLFLLVSL